MDSGQRQDQFESNAPPLDLRDYDRLRRDCRVGTADMDIGGQAIERRFDWM